jgi:predicted phosphodiesterase
MKIAVIGDIHGYLPGFSEALSVIDGMRCDRIVCVGDIIDGYPENNRVVEILRARNDIASLRGNHDEVDVPGLHREHRAWLQALPDSLHVEGFDFFHFSPRRRDEKMNSVYAAWNAFDDGDFRNAVVGHAHIRALFRFRKGMGTQAEEIRVADHEAQLDTGFRHIIVNPSLSYNRSGPECPAFTIIDTVNLTTRIIDLAIPPMDLRLRR